MDPTQQHGRRYTYELALSTWISASLLSDPDRFTADSDASLSEEIVAIAMAQAAEIIEPDGIGNAIGRELVAPVSISGLIRAISAHFPDSSGTSDKSHCRRDRGHP